MTIDDNDDELKVKILKTHICSYGLGVPVLRINDHDIDKNDFNQSMNVDFYTEWIPTDGESHEHIIEYSEYERRNAFANAYNICKEKLPFIATPIYKTKFGVGKLCFSANSLIDIAKMKHILFDVMHEQYQKWMNKLEINSYNSISVKRFMYDMNDTVAGLYDETAYKLVSNEDYLWLFDLLESKLHINNVDVWMSSRFNDISGVGVIKKNVFTSSANSSSSCKNKIIDVSSYFDGGHSRFWTPHTIRGMSEDALIEFDLNCGSITE